MMREFELISRIVSRLKVKDRRVLVGPGDDAAVLRLNKNWAITTDLLVEGVHFRRQWMTPKQLARKAVRVNLSDLAAMGAAPRFALVSLGLPRSLPNGFVKIFSEELVRSLDKNRVVLLGGDTKVYPVLVVNVVLMGEGRRLVTRRGLRAGDRLYVTGTLGSAALGLEALKKNKRKGYERFILRQHEPPVRLAVARRLSSLKAVHAMMDLSDGLAGDLRHLLKTNRLGAEIQSERLPCDPSFKRMAKKLGRDPFTLQVSGGEDYELLVAASSRFRMPRSLAGVKLTEVGRVVAKSGQLFFRDASGKHLTLQKGYEHAWS